MSKNTPSFQYYPADMATDPEAMFWSMEQIGCYHAMIDYLWLNGGKIDGNSSDFPAKLRRIFRVSHRKKAQKLWENIVKKFIIEDGIIYHKRVTKEIQRQTETRVSRSEGGKKGMESRWGKPEKKDNIVTNPTITPDNSSISTSISSSKIESLLIINKSALIKRLKTDHLIYYRWFKDKFVVESRNEQKTFNFYAKLCQSMSEIDKNFSGWLTDTIADIREGCKINKQKYPIPNKLFITAINNRIKKMKFETKAK